MLRVWSSFILAAPVLVSSMAVDLIASQAARGKEAAIWYLGHCGFAVKISEHMLLLPMTSCGRKPIILTLPLFFPCTRTARSTPRRILICSENSRFGPRSPCTRRQAIPDTSNSRGPFRQRWPGCPSMSP